MDAFLMKYRRFLKRREIAVLISVPGALRGAGRVKEWAPAAVRARSAGGFLREGARSAAP